MNVLRGLGRSGAMGRWFSHLVLFVFVCRSLIPVGFMPEFKSASGDTVHIVICTGYGQQTVDLDANGHKLPSKPGASHHQPCAFSAFSSLSDVPLAVGIIAPSDRATVIAEDRIFGVLPPVRAGPAVGSRAPPHIS